METRLCNIFETTKAIILTNAIIETLIKFYKIYQKEQP